MPSEPIAVQDHSDQPPGPGWPPVMTDEEAKAKLRAKVKARDARSAATTEPVLARYRMTVIFEAEDDGEAEFAEEKVEDRLRSYNFPVIDQRLEKLL